MQFCPRIARAYLTCNEGTVFRIECTVFVLHILEFHLNNIFIFISPKYQNGISFRAKYYTNTNTVQFEWGREGAPIIRCNAKMPMISSLSLQTTVHIIAMPNSIQFIIFSCHKRAPGLRGINVICSILFGAFEPIHTVGCFCIWSNFLA